MDRLYADFHVHSSCSDGTCSPSEDVQLALRAGLKAFALTDHDTLDGLPEALAEGRRLGIEVIPGIEFSCAYQDVDIHIVGLDLSLDNDILRAHVAHSSEERKNRNRRMIEKMAADGIDISWEKMEAEFGRRMWTRAHFARHLMKLGLVGSVHEAFNGYVGNHDPYFIPRVTEKPGQVVRLIRETGGIPVLAHPFQYNLTQTDFDRLLSLLRENGLIGIEALYSTHTPQQEREARCIARRFGLCISGGSDFHGDNKPGIFLGTGFGNLKIPYELITLMRERKLRALPGSVD